MEIMEACLFVWPGTTQVLTGKLMDVVVVAWYVFRSVQFGVSATGSFS
jgi:hypothetical protein